MKSLKSIREVKRLIGRVVTLNRFISQPTDKFLPFVKTLRGMRESLRGVKEVYGKSSNSLLTNTGRRSLFVPGHFRLGSKFSIDKRRK